MRVQPLFVAGDDARRFLAAMLQGMQPQIGELGRLGVAVDGHHPAFVFELICH